MAKTLAISHSDFKYVTNFLTIAILLAQSFIKSLSGA